MPRNSIKSMETIIEGVDAKYNAGWVVREQCIVESRRRGRYEEELEGRKGGVEGTYGGEGRLLGQYYDVLGVPNVMDTGLF